MKYNVYELKSLNTLLTGIKDLSTQMNKDVTMCHYIEEVIIHDEGDARVGVIKFDADIDDFVFHPDTEYFQEDH